MNAVITKDVLSGKVDGKRTAVVLNAGMAIHLAKPELTLAQGFDMAKDIIDSGKAMDKLNEFITVSQRVAKG